MRRTVDIWRDTHGVPHVEAASETDMYRGQGYVHATDRGLQMLLMRIVGQGRTSELLDSGDDAFEVDRFFRRMGWAANTGEQIEALSERDRACLEAYCDGANTAFAEHVPWELRLLGYRHEPWTPADSIMMTRVVGYLTLAESQAGVERFFVELVQAGVPLDRLEELFPGLLGGLDIELLKQVRLGERVVPPQVMWDVAVPRMMASNNWVIAGTRTASGKPILANDPHLEANRLPAVWSEIVLRSEGRYIMGGSMPGFPGVPIGRTPDIAWAVTYAWLDSLDSWIERCQGGRYYREKDGNGDWHDFRKRTAVILRKKKSPVEVTFYENEHGVLDGDPHEDGYYLATRWAAGDGGAGALRGTLRIFDARTVDEGMRTLAQVETGWNFVFATPNGDIGYQMSGRMPRRRDGVSGFVPLPGWKAENDWQGWVDREDLPNVKNPPEGFFATANQNLNRYGKVNASTIWSASYRADRISDLLRRRNDFTVEDVYSMHFDVYSLQAEAFMNVLRPLLPDTRQGRTLRQWDCRYDLDSKGAYLFEQVYRELIREVFGRDGFGKAVVDFLRAETGVLAGVHGNFDRVLLAERSAWFADRCRNDLFRDVAVRALDCEPRAWGEVQQFMMKHLLFRDKLPAALGFDRGPLAAKGSRATIHVSQIFKSGGRETSYLPSYRLVTDLAGNTLHTTLAGGPSDRRFSRWYASDVDDWLAGNYKAVTADSNQPKLPFKYLDLGPPRLSDFRALAKRVRVDLNRVLGGKTPRDEVAG